MSGYGIEVDGQLVRCHGREDAVIRRDRDHPKCKVVMWKFTKGNRYVWAPIRGDNS